VTENVETPQPFDIAVELTPSAPWLSIARSSPAYNNMVGPYGGITVAILQRLSILSV